MLPNFNWKYINTYIVYSVLYMKCSFFPFIAYNFSAFYSLNLSFES